MEIVKRIVPKVKKENYSETFNQIGYNIKGLAVTTAKF